jgi:hypothetical protein
MPPRSTRLLKRLAWDIADRGKNNMVAQVEVAVWNPQAQSRGEATFPRFGQGRRRFPA